ncbi:hypothetical protein [Amphibacillus indicireducens]
MRTFRQVEWNADKLGGNADKLAEMQTSRRKCRQVEWNADKLGGMLSS